MTRRMQESDDVEFNSESFRAAVEANLASGSFRLVIVVDTITEELRRVVEFLDAHTVPDLQVIALELDYAADSGVEMLLPTVYGLDAAREKTARSSRHRTTEADLRSALNEWCVPETVEGLTRILDHARNHPQLRQMGWGAGANPSCHSELRHPLRRCAALEHRHRS